MKTINKHEILSTIYGISQKKKQLIKRKEIFSYAELFCIIWALILLIQDQIFSMLGAILLAIPTILEIIMITQKKKIRDKLMSARIKVENHKEYLVNFYSLYYGNIEEDKKFKKHFEIEVNTTRAILKMLDKS